MGNYKPYNREAKCKHCNYKWFCKSENKRTTCPECQSAVYLTIRVIKYHLELNRKSLGDDFDADKWIQEKSDLTPEEYRREISKSQKELENERQKRKEKQRREIEAIFR